MDPIKGSFYSLHLPFRTVPFYPRTTCSPGVALPPTKRTVRITALQGPEGCSLWFHHALCFIPLTLSQGQPPGASCQITYRLCSGKYRFLPAGNQQVLKARAWGEQWRRGLPTLYWTQPCGVANMSWALNHQRQDPCPRRVKFRHLGSLILASASLTFKGDREDALMNCHQNKQLQWNQRAPGRLAEGKGKQIQVHYSNSSTYCPLGACPAQAQTGKLSQDPSNQLLKKCNWLFLGP